MTQNNEDVVFNLYWFTYTIEYAMYIVLVQELATILFDKNVIEYVHNTKWNPLQDYS